MKRRDFCKSVGLSGLAVGLSQLGASSATANPKTPRGNKVAILGGGVAGLSAAHELLERGFEVSIYETRREPGGKARSVMHGSLPGEHGFRFYPAFYYHLWNTMSRIPFGRNRNGVLDNMVPIERITFSVKNQRDIPLNSRIPKNEADFHLMFSEMFTPKFGISKEETLFFSKRMVTFLTSCEKRRLAEFEKMPWMDFLDGYNKSKNFQKFVALGLTRNVVAAKGDRVSARTVASMSFQLIQGIWSNKGSFGFFLNGPTSDVWISPWMKYLGEMGLDYHGEAKCVAMNTSAGQIDSVRVVENGVEKEIYADWYIAAMPAEVMAGLVNNRMASYDPQFSRLKNIIVDWMTGIQFYFDRPIKIGHTGPMNYVDSPWALTSITQSNIWKKPMKEYGDGSVRGLLSIDISNWDSPGILYGRKAKECTLEEIKNEVMAQILEHIDGEYMEDFRAAKLLDYHLDPGITFDAAGMRNADPLLINTPDSWKDRPEATTAISNLFLAADYVRTHSDLACMEAANEAARRAVNGLITEGGYDSPLCGLRPLTEPSFFALGKQADRARFAMGLPHPGMKSNS